MTKSKRLSKYALEIQLSFGASDSTASLRKGVPSKVSLQAFAQAAVDASKVTGLAKQIGLSIRFVDKKEAKLINHQYRQKDYATNVLSFATENFPGAPKDWLGDLVICVPVIAVEAKKFGKSLRDHYAHMCVHGVLHLLGFDHLNQRDAAQMEGLETQIMAEFGVSDPYLMGA